MSAPILVTGGGGQLATSIAERAGGRPIHRIGRPEFDFDRPDTIDAAFHAAQPGLVVNTAAWTAVDAAETEPEAAKRANTDGPAQLARLTAAAGIPLIHISTDYVFDGRKGAPYTEDDPTNPTGIYGATKLAGEEAVLARNPRAIILRTSWVYAGHGKNFIRTMLGAARKTGTLRVVADQQGCPTAAPDLADAILAIADRITDWRPPYAGIFHAAGQGSTTWHGLATTALEEAAQHGHPLPAILPITTADWPTPAHRPADSRLACTKLTQAFGLTLPPWEHSTRAAVRAAVMAGV